MPVHGRKASLPSFFFYLFSVSFIFCSCGKDNVSEGDHNDVEVDKEAPYVVNAFSKDGESVTVHFNEDMDPESAGNPSNYTILGSDNSTLPIESAEVSGKYTHLYLSTSAVINPDLTYTLLAGNEVKDLAGNRIDRSRNSSIITRTLYLAIIWHQHQPTYLDPSKDELSGPWVRKHAVKDYYDMAAILENYPDVHLNINLTQVMLTQLEEYYIKRLGPYVDTKNNRVDETAFLNAWQGKTDPFIDLLLKDTPSREDATEDEIDLFYKGAWSCVSTSDAVMGHFLEYKALRDGNRDSYDKEEFLKLKGFFEIAWFDPDFLRGPVTLPDGNIVDLSDVVEEREGETFYLKTEITEDLCNRFVAEEYKIMANVVEIHDKLKYNPSTKKGQIEISTTPFYHPILPLLHDSDLAAEGQPYDTLPAPPFSYPEDASAQVGKAVYAFKEKFGMEPKGMWPGEGSVAEEIVPVFVAYDIDWIATGQQVLERSGYSEFYYPYMVDTDSVSGDGGVSGDEVMVVFRYHELSDKVGFAYQTSKGEESSADFIESALRYAPAFGSEDRLITVVVDGENPWENYRYDLDGKSFLNNLYALLQESYEVGEIVTVTISEYIEGNDERNVPSHPVQEQREIEPLWAGSWIDGTFSTWIGETEENLAWGYLLTARRDLAISGLSAPDPLSPPPPDATSIEYYIYKAWDEMYAAEGSDWFWWYGEDQTSAGNDDTPFDEAFRAHLTAIYTFSNLAGAEIEVPNFPPIIQPTPQIPSGPFTDPPEIDGVFTPNETEWTNEGGYYYDNDSSGIQTYPDDDIARFLYGYDEDNFYMAFEFNEKPYDKLNSDYNIAIYFSHKHILDFDTGDYLQDPYNTTTRYGRTLQFVADGAARELYLSFSSSTVTATLSEADGYGGWIPESSHDIVIGGPVEGEKVLELMIPFGPYSEEGRNLNIEYGDPLEILIVVSEGSREVDIAPNANSYIIFEDVTLLVFVTFVVDVTGSEIPIDLYVDITNPPPPDGTGSVYIVGNKNELGNWIPNTIGMFDDGTSGDEVAGDNLWTRTFGFMPGDLILYKYTIGDYLDDWGGTEEFPLTNRGFTVTDSNGDGKMKIYDIFADRPNPSGTIGSMSEIEND